MHPGERPDARQASESEPLQLSSSLCLNTGRGFALVVRPLGLEPRTVSIRRGGHVGDPGGKDSCADGYDTDGQAYDRKSQ